MKFKTIIAALVLIALTATSCLKNPVASNGDYLRYSKATANVHNKSGDKAVVWIQSNVSWKLAFENATPDWVIADKMDGTNTDSLVVTATKDNNTAGYKFANIIASPINNSNLSPVRLTIVQYDSSYKGK